MRRPLLCPANSLGYQVEAVRVAVRRIESDFLLFPSAGMVGFHPHSMALPVNKPDERAGRFLAPLLEVVNSEQSEVLEAGIILRSVGGSDMFCSL